MKAIVAIDHCNGIAKDGKIPWNNPSDMCFFRFMTMGHPVIMGRKTFESLKRPLKGRLNIVLTKEKRPSSDGLIFCDYNFAIRLLETEAMLNDTFVIGGEQIYNLFFEERRIQELFVTQIHGNFDCDKRLVIPDYLTENKPEVFRLHDDAPPSGYIEVIKYWS